MKSSIQKRHTAPGLIFLKLDVYVAVNNVRLLFVAMERYYSRGIDCTNEQKPDLRLWISSLN